MYVLMVDAHIPFYQEGLTQWTNDQKELLFWCRFYNHHVFSQPKKERPDDSIVKYDILLDEWIKKKEFAEKQRQNKKGLNQTWELN